MNARKEEVVDELWNRYDSNAVQEGLKLMLVDHCPYKSTLGHWVAEDKVLLALDFIVDLVDLLDKRKICKKDVFRMFPSIGNAMRAFESSEYVTSSEEGRKIKVSHLFLVDVWDKHITEMRDVND